MSTKYGRIFLNKQHIDYLMMMLETKDAQQAIENFTVIMVELNADPSKMDKYLDKIMAVPPKS